MAFWVYLLRCADGSYYTGHSDDLERRIGQHNAGAIPGYTLDRLPVKLAWCEQFESRYEALTRERQIKGWSRAKKEALIAGDWERISVLSRSRTQK
ncbi:MAG: COG2827: putative endonuclease containing a URI domain [uncultured Chloroflexi bacterium]|uniref:COG2827: putative endonuclease containing a URI domain n=1 Tax=uncultured Chloroflexota bacterium TaxID=166587 RepID=A0A6J4ITV5_9CHLR|nr:MAG: COG2827: putative endonuclease containing a URI domain [uncultured Chloroflexota bacterium]